MESDPELLVESESEAEEESSKSEVDVTRRSSDDRLSEPKTKEIVENLSLGTPSTNDEQIIYDADKKLTDVQIEKCTKWIKWFCSIEGHEFLCDINPEMFEKYDFYEFRNLQPHTYNRAINLITGCKEIVLEKETNEISQSTKLSELNELYVLSVKNKKLLMAAAKLYGIIHSLYLQTADGQNKIHSRFMAGEYGKCPRVLCLGQPLMPISIDKKINLYSVKMYCASCSEIYEPETEICLDGNFFGTGLPDLFFMNFPELRPILITEYEQTESPEPPKEQSKSEESKICLIPEIVEPIIYVAEEPLPAQQPPLPPPLIHVTEDSSHSTVSSPGSLSYYSTTSSSSTSSSSTQSCLTSSSTLSNTLPPSTLPKATPQPPQPELKPNKPTSLDDPTSIEPMSTETMSPDPMSAAEPMSPESLPTETPTTYPEKFFKTKTQQEKINDLDSEIKKGLAVRVYDDDEYFIESKKDWFSAGAVTAHYRINTKIAEEFTRKKLQKQKDTENKIINRRVHSMSIEDESTAPQKRQRLEEVN